MRPRGETVRHVHVQFAEPARAADSEPVRTDAIAIAIANANANADATPAASVPIVTLASTPRPGTACAALASNRATPA